MKQEKKKILLWSIIPAIIILLVIACGIYVSDYYHADQKAIADFDCLESITIEQKEDHLTAYIPKNATAGFIFYPGGKVEHTAYEPLMLACAEQGILCVLVEMPFRLAVLDMDAAKDIPSFFPEIENWYIGGHSLGGSMAASYLKDTQKQFDGLILLGSYSTADFSESSLDILSMYGSEDKVLNMEKYETYKTNLPTDCTEIVIDGGCHAYFGMYGKQSGDGVPTITNTEQLQITADEIGAFIIPESQ